MAIREATGVPGHAHEDVATCPFCGQPLIDREAVRRVQESERELEQKLEAEAQAKAEPLAKKLAAAAEAEAAKKVKALERDVAVRETQISKLKRQHEQELKQAKEKLEQHVRELEALNKVMFGREDRILELKEQVGLLRAQLSSAGISEPPE